MKNVKNEMLKINTGQYFQHQPFKHSNISFGFKQEIVLALG